MATQWHQLTRLDLKPNDQNPARRRGREAFDNGLSRWSRSVPGPPHRLNPPVPRAVTAVAYDGAKTVASALRNETVWSPLREDGVDRRALDERDLSRVPLLAPSGMGSAGLFPTPCRWDTTTCVLGTQRVSGIARPLGLVELWRGMAPRLRADEATRHDQRRGQPPDTPGLRPRSISCDRRWVVEPNPKPEIAKTSR